MNIEKILIEDKITGIKILELSNIFIPKSSIVGIKSTYFEDVILFFSAIAGIIDLYPDFNFDIKINNSYSEVLYFPEYPYTQISGLTSTVYAEVSLPLVERCINETDIKRKVNKFLSLYELEKLKDRNPYNLSTGELQKLLLCSQDICEPEIWLLIYPFSGLDKKNKAKIKQILLARKKNRIIFIFDQNIEEEFIDFILDLKDGTLNNVNFHYKKKEHIEILPDYLHIKKVKENKNSDLLIELQNINFSYDEKNSLLKNLSLDIKEGEIVLITGPNGCGKTTLAKIIAGILKPKNGKFYKNKKTDIIYIPSDPTNLFLKTRVKDEIEFILDWKKGKHNLDKILNTFNLKDDIDKYIYELSLEKKKHLSIIEAVLLEKNLIILDEPTSFATENFRKLLIAHIKDGLLSEKSLVIISHDTHLICELNGLGT